LPIDVWFFICTTGSGKITLVLYLAGTTFQEAEQDDENNDCFDHYVPFDFPQPKLTEFKAAPGATSVTRIIQAVGVDPQRVVLVDTPGFQDTEGYELDIANESALIGAFQRDRTIKPILVLNAKELSFGRFQSLKDTLNTVTRMMMDTSKNVDFGAFHYLFTHCEEKPSASIVNLSRCKRRSFVRRRR
jgi:hypothetical protein